MVSIDALRPMVVTSRVWFPSPERTLRKHSLEREKLLLSQAGSFTTEQLVSETDYVQLSRFVTEYVSNLRVDRGRADTVHDRLNAH